MFQQGPKGAFGSIPAQEAGAYKSLDSSYLAAFFPFFTMRFTFQSLSLKPE